MASNKLSATILVISLLCYSTVTTACGGCVKPPPVYEKPPVYELPPPVYEKPPPVYGECPGGECVEPPPVYEEYCPRDALKLGVCVNILGLIPITIGSPPSHECCALLAGLVDLEAAACLCTAIKANVLGINLNVPVSISLILSACQKYVPPGFECI